VIGVSDGKSFCEIFSPKEKNDCEKSKILKKRGTHRIYIHTNRLIIGVFSQIGVSLTALISKRAIYVHMVLNLFYDS